MREDEAGSFVFYLLSCNISSSNRPNYSRLYRKLLPQDSGTRHDNHGCARQDHSQRLVVRLHFLQIQPRSFIEYICPLGVSTAFIGHLFNHLGTDRSVPEWSKGADLRSARRKSARVQTPSDRNAFPSMHFIAMPTFLCMSHHEMVKHAVPPTEP
jgi:hypothetical protein